MVKFLQSTRLLKIAVCIATIATFAIGSYALSAISASSPITRVNSLGATVTPAEGNVESLQSFEIVFPNATEVATTFSREACPTLYSVDGGYNVATFTSASVDGNKLSLSAYAAITAQGQYELRLPGAAYTVDGVAGEDLVFSYTIVASAKTLEYTVTPEADEDGNVSTISPIVVTFPNAAAIEANPEADYWTYAKVEYNSPKAGLGEIPAEIQLQSNTILVFLEESDQIAGEFTLTIPAGTYLVDGVENEEIVKTFNYVVTSQDYAVVLPEEGEVEALQNFTIEFPNATEVATTFSREACPTIYNVDGGYNVATFTSGSVDGNKLSLAVNAAITTVGQYELRVPGAAYTVDGEVGQDLAFAYTIVSSAKTLEYTVTPEADEDGNVSTISPIVVTFPNAAAIEANPEADYWTYAKVEYNSPKASVVETEFEVQIQGNTLLFFLSEQDQIAGEFILTIPAGTYLVDGVENEEIVKTFNYVVASQDYAVVLPAEGEVEALQAFEIEFPNATEVATTFSREACPTLYSVDGGYNVATFTSGSVDGNKLSLSAYAAITAQGQYELRLPGAAYTVDGVAGEDLVFSYTIVASAKTLEYTVTPEADEDGNVSTISPIVVTFPNAAAIEANPEADYWTYAKVEYNSPKAGPVETDTEVQIQGNTLLFFLSEQDQIAGEFTLTIPAGTYLVDGVENEEIVKTFNYVVASQDYAVVLPAEGEVAALQAFEIEFPNATEVATTFSREACPTLYCVDGGYNVATFTSASVDGNKMSLSANSAITVAGQYELRIPGAAYTLDGVAGEDLVFSYTIVVDPLEYTINPANGETIESFSSVVIKFANASSVTVDDTDYTLYPYIEGYDSSWGWNEYDTNVTCSGNEIVLTVPSYVTLASGDYHVVVPAGIVTADGSVLNEEIFSSFTLKQAVPEFAVVIDPAEGTVSSLKEFNITFKDVDEVLLNNYTNDTKFYIEAEDGTKSYPSDSFVNYDADGAPIYLEFAEITAVGKYTLVLPAKSYKVNGVYGEELRFEYTISDESAISNIFVNGVDSVDVYDLRGVRVLNNAKAEDLRNLNTNVYIINGQKYLLRK